MHIEIEKKNWLCSKIYEENSGKDELNKVEQFKDDIKHQLHFYNQVMCCQNLNNIISNSIKALNT